MPSQPHRLPPADVIMQVFVIMAPNIIQATLYWTVSPAGSWMSSGGAGGKAADAPLPTTRRAGWRQPERQGRQQGLPPAQAWLHALLGLPPSPPLR